jgi:hypothetical protein
MALAALAATSGGSSARSPSATRSSCLGFLSIDLILPCDRVLRHSAAGFGRITPDMIEQAGDIEEGIDGDAGSIAQWEARGGLFGHPGRDGQAAFGELDAERSPRLLIDEHRSKPLAHEGVIRVQDRDDLVTGIVSVASLGGLSLWALGRSSRSREAAREDRGSRVT